MYSITLISTIHSENGKCNDSELYKILESIKPDVIFEEMPSSHFNAYYVTKTQRSLESDTINQYFKNYNVKILPVDIDVTQKLSKHKDEILFMFSTFFKNEDYKKLDDEKEVLITQEGFCYLNSDKFLDFLAKKEIVEKNIIDSEIQKDRLPNVYKLFHAEQHDNRENAMLQNIYNFSKENQYKQAVFLLGAGHRKSIVEKITEYEKISGIKLNWTLYSNK